MNPQTPARLTGSASMSFQNPVYVVSCASVVGKKEGEGPLGSKFDLVCEEPMFGEATWEAAESTMQKEAAALALGKAGLTPGDIRMTFAGDLLAQTTASSFGIAGMGIPFYGLFGACSTIGESLSLGAMSVAAGYGEHILCATSSHFASAEKEFRFPLAYGNQRPLSATWTVTGSGACVLSGTLPVPKIPEKTDPLISAEGCVQITGLTTGKLIDFGLKDSLNMGGCMAPAACDTIYRNFCDFDRTPDDYDAIFTGDLGAVGKRILLDLLKEKGYDNITAEVCPHHFILSSDDIKTDDPNYKMNPPLRTPKDVEALKQGLKDGTIEVISTDHAPHSAQEKTGSMKNAPFGIVGLETSLPLTYTELVEKDVITLKQMVEKMCLNPAKILGLDRGTLQKGHPADVIIVDTEQEYAIDKNKFVSKGHNTPFDGWKVKGKVLYTICDGKIVFKNQEEKES